MTEQMTDQEQPEAGSGKDLLTRLADAGEDAIQKLAEMPGGKRVADAVNGVRVRVDELQRRVRGIDELEARVAELEQKVAASETKRTRRVATTSASSEPPTPGG
jgi:predicted metalloprotease